MNPNDTHREQLSALIDGALDADQSRFLLRRLQHDGELADRLSRWQLAGDVLRNQADAPAPAGFAEAITARIADEPTPLVEAGGIAAPVSRAPESEAAARVPVARGARWRWFGGGAMAASLAIASVLALRPDALTFAPTDYAATEIASPAAASSVVDAASNNNVATSAPVTVAAESVTNREQTVPATTSTTPVRSNDVTPAPVRIARAAPAPTRAASVRERGAEPVAPRVTLPNDSTSRTAQAEPAPAADPFQPPAAKAWPRAVVPGAGNGTFNASLNSDASYYPFAPRDTEPADSE